MVFSAPSFLWALALVAIPIAIHLFQFKRYKRLYFSDISLLKEVKSLSQTKNRLRHLLILLSRVAFVAFAAIAFSQPFIPAETQIKQEFNGISIYIDNSFSMEAESSTGSLLENAKQTAYRIADSYPNGTRFQLITNGFTASEKRFTDVDDFITALDELQLSPNHRTVREVMDFQTQSLRDGKQVVKSYLISDFINTLDSNLSPLDSNKAITLIPLRSAQEENISIDSVWCAMPLSQSGIEQALHFRINNRGQKPVVDLTVNLEGEGLPYASIVLSLEGQTARDTFISFIPEKAGFITGKISVEDYPIVFDNTYFFSFEVSDQLNISEIKGSVDDKSSPFKKLFSSERFQFSSFYEDGIIQDTVLHANLLILNQLENWSSGLTAVGMELLESGKNIAIIPPKNVSVGLATGLKETFGIGFSNWDTTTLTVQSINRNNSLFSAVFDSESENTNLPKANGHFSIETGGASENILEMYNGAPMLAAKKSANGQVFILSTPLEDSYTNFHRHALFVPAFINMAGQSGISRQLSVKVGSSHFKTDHTSSAMTLEGINDSMVLVPSRTFDGIMIGDQLNRAGWFALKSEKGNTLDVLSFNYSRRESSIASYEPTKLLAYFNDRGFDASMLDASSNAMTQKIMQANLGTELWPIFLSLALLFLLIESALLKFFGS